MKKILLALFTILLIGSFTSFGQLTKSLAVFGSSTAACFPTDPISYNGCWLGDLRDIYNKPGVTQINPLSVYALNTATLFNALPMSYPPLGNVYAPSTGNTYNFTPQSTYTIDNILSPNPKPDVAIINYPSSGYEVLDIHDVLLYFRTIYNAATAQGIAVYIATPQPRNDFVNGAEDWKKLKEIRDSIMLEYGNFAIDFWTPLANTPDDGLMNTAYKYSPSDGVHVNTVGHTLLYQQVLAKDIFGWNSLVLPVKIKSFDATLNTSIATLKWVADEESAGTKYVIEKSSDGNHFKPIAEVKGLEQASDNKYSFSDPEPVLSGPVYYRLRVVEYAGSYYSSIRKLSASASSYVVERVFPNPSTTEINVEIQSNQSHVVRIDIISSLGQLVLSGNKTVGTGQNLITIPINKLNNGMYFIKISNSFSNTYIQKFIKN